MHAKFVRRVYAFLYDYLIFVAYAGIISIVSWVLNPLYPTLFTNLFMTSPFISQLTGLCVVTLPLVLYFAISESSVQQATWGKKKMKLQVTDRDGNRIRFGRSLLRSSVKFLPWELGHFAAWRMMLPSGISDTIIYVVLSVTYGLVLIYFIIPLTNKRRQSMYDWIAGTQVIRSPQ